MASSPKGRQHLLQPLSQGSLHPVPLSGGPESPPAGRPSALVEIAPPRSPLVAVPLALHSPSRAVAAAAAAAAAAGTPTSLSTSPVAAASPVTSAPIVADSVVTDLSHSDVKIENSQLGTPLGSNAPVDDDNSKQPQSTQSSTQSNRRHRLLIRRSSSFKRIDTITTTANEFFLTDPTTHREWAAFFDSHAASLSDATSTDGGAPDGGDGGDGGAGAGAVAGSHAATQVHKQWELLVDGQVSRLLAANNATEAELYEMLKIDRDEERREGLRFHRWNEIIEFQPMMVALRATATAAAAAAAAAAAPNFEQAVTAAGTTVAGTAAGTPPPPPPSAAAPSTAPAAAGAGAVEAGAGAAAPPAAHPGVRAVLGVVAAMAEQARCRRRRVVSIFPVLARWSPATFAVVDRAVTAALGVDGVRAGLSRVQLKELVRWRSKLTRKVLSHGDSGTYVDQRPDEVEWARFIGFATSQMAPASFDAFIAAFDSNADEAIVGADAAASDDLRAVTEARRSALRVFGCLDSYHLGRVSLSKVTRALVRCKLLAAGKAKAKFTARWRARLAQLAATQRAEGTAAELDDGDDESLSSGVSSTPSSPSAAPAAANGGGGGGGAGRNSGTHVPLHEAIELIFDAVAPGKDMGTVECAVGAMPGLRRLLDQVC